MNYQHDTFRFVCQQTLYDILHLQYNGAVILRGCPLLVDVEMPSPMAVM